MEQRERFFSIVESFFQNGGIEIEFDFGLSALAKFQSEMDLLARGVSFSDLNYAENKENSLPKIIAADGSMIVPTSKQPLSSADIPEGSIAYLTLNGVMRSESGLCTQGIDALCSNLLEAYNNPKIDGIFLKIGSGGGETAAGSRLQSMIQDAPKSVVVYTDTILGSAAVRGAAPAEMIIAAEGARLGSIGTYCTLPKGFAEFYNKYYQDIYADASSEKNKSHRAMLNGDLSQLKGEINKINDQFIAEVTKFRQLKGSSQAQKHTLSGAMFSAEEAKKRGLVDKVGSHNFAISELYALVGKRKKMQ
jgi:ClpP class serine protease